MPYKPDNDNYDYFEADIPNSEYRWSYEDYEAARRARQLSQGATPLSKADSNKEVSIAINEIFEGKVSAVSSNMFHPTRIETDDTDNF